MPDSEALFPEDTPRIQRALESCPAGEAVELAAEGELYTFQIGPLELPGGVTLWIDPGVVLRMVQPTTLEVASGATQPAVLAGFGTVETLSPGSGTGPIPLHVDASSDLHVAGVILRSTGAIVLEAATPTLFQDAKLLGPLRIHGAAPVRITGSTLAEAPKVLDAAAETHVLLDGVAIYRDTGAGQGLSPGTAWCVLPTGTQPECQPAALPPLLTELVQSAPREVSALILQPDLQLPDPAGTVELLENDAVLARTKLRGSAAVFSVGALPEGIHRLRARYVEEDLVFGDLQMETARARPQQGTPVLALTASATSFPYGTPLTLTASLAGGTGVVTFLDGSSILGQAAMLAGSASVSTSTLAIGPHSVSAAYAGDTTNPAQTSPALSLQVNPVTTQLTLASLPLSISYGTLLTLAGSVLPVTATGGLSFHDGATLLGQAALQHGAASLPVAGLAPGEHTLYATYGGDGYNLPAAGAAQTVTVEPLSTTTALASTPAHLTFGTAVVLSVAVLPADASGTVTLWDGVTLLGRVTLGSGAGSLTVPLLQPGSHALTALYSGDAAHTGSGSSVTLVTVDPVGTSTILGTLPASVAAGTALTLSASVSPANATGTITFTDRNSGVLGTIPLVSGSASLPRTVLAAGVHTLTGTYSGDAQHAPSASAPVAVTVLPAQASLTLSGLPASVPYGVSLSLRASLSPASATGSVTLTDQTGALVGTALVSGGSASWTLPLLVPGTHVLQARYSGDATFGAADASTSLAVTQDVTVTTLSASANTVTAGAPLLLNVAVHTSTGNSATGTVQVRIGNLTLNAPLDHALPGTGYATVPVDSAALGLGNFSAMASYAGDSGDLPSASGPVSVQVAAAPVSLNLTASPNPAAAGLPVALTALLQSSLGVPAGTVTFFRNGVSMLAVPVSGGAAGMQLPGMAAGTYALTASYQPAGLFGPAVAPAQVLVVAQPFQLSLNPDELSIQPGAEGVSVLRIAGQYGFSRAYTATCTSPVAYLSCSLLVPAGTVSAATEVRVHAAAATAVHRPHNAGPLLAVLALPLLLLRGPRRRVLLCAVLLLPAGCAPGTFFNVPPGSFTMTVSVSAGGSLVSVPLTIHIVSP